MRKLILIALSLIAFSVPATAADSEELKAAIVYNIVRFTRLPPQPSDTLMMCVAANAATVRAFAQLEGKVVPNGRLAIHAVARPSDIKAGCAIAFVEGDISPVTLTSVAMTISDSVGFAERGGTIELRRFGRQISFEINARAGARKGVRFSAGLLNLAAAVHAQ